MQNILPKEPRSSKQYDLFIPKDLETCEFVFLRLDRVKTGLTAPYEGPYKELKRLRKHFVIEVKGKHTSVSFCYGDHRSHEISG